MKQLMQKEIEAVEGKNLIPLYLVNPKESDCSHNDAACTFHPFPSSRALRITDDHRILLKDKVFLEGLVDEVRRIVIKNDIRVLSFDVFDTALLRRAHCEARRFLQVAIAFSLHCNEKFSPVDALIARAMAARYAYNITPAAADGTREGSFDVIANIVCSQLGVPEMIARYIETELEFEKQNLESNDIVEVLRNALPNVSIVFISDMYLESGKIHKLLVNAFGSKVPVFSSADGSGSKRSGGLFQFVSRQLKIDPQRIMHFGDSLEGDFRQAKRSGFMAYYLPLPEAEKARREKCYRALNLELAELGVDLPSFLHFQN